jgi:hypothetical protein
MLAKAGEIPSLLFVSKDEFSRTFNFLTLPQY